MRDVRGRALRTARSPWLPVAFVAMLSAGAGLELADRSRVGEGLRAALIAATVVTAAVVVLLRRMPFATAVVSGAIWFIPGVAVGARWANAGPPMVLFVLIVIAFVLGAHERGPLVLGGTIAVMLGISAGDFSDPVPMFVFAVPAAVAGAALQSRNQLTAQLEARARELDNERDAYAREAVRFERARIARELHDIVGHNLSLMVIQAGAGQRQLNSDVDRAAESLRHIGAAAREAERELEQLARLLGADESSPVADAGGIEALVRQAGAAGLPVHLRLSGRHDKLESPLSAAVYRVAQEGLTNALKHAPGAQIQVTVQVDDAEVHVGVRNGPSSEMPGLLRAASGQHGLDGMRERVRELGGELKAGQTTEGGWSLAARLPLLSPPR